MTLDNNQIEAMQEDISIELVQMLMQDWNYDMAKALDTLYNSETFERLCNTDTGLYYQSAGYVYDFLQNELRTGRLA